MKRGLKFVLLAALGAGTLSTGAVAQQRQLGNSEGAVVEHATFDPGQGGALRLADWDDHRRCDGDHDRDDRGCYYRDGYGRYVYRGPAYYGNGYYAAPAPYYAQPNGWYDRDGRWHAYDRDRDRDLRRHDDDDRR